VVVNDLSEGAEALFTFFSARYERDSLAITTNLDLARQKELLGFHIHPFIILDFCILFFHTISLDQFESGL
jgi:DNA replication protein DnaC